MKKTELAVKNINDITIENKIDLIDTIVSAYFQENEYGEIEYTPYLKEVGQVIAIAKYLIDGIKFTKKEKIYDSVIKDPELKPLIDEVLSSTGFANIMIDVEDIVEYKKKENIAKIQNSSSSIIAYKLMELIDKETQKVEKELAATENLNKWIDEQRELNSLITPEMQKNFAETLNADSLINAVIDKYSESEIYNKNRKAVEASKTIREQNNKIIELKDELSKKNQKDNVKNVLADKKK